jgi:predicted nucleotidyltransferase
MALARPQDLLREIRKRLQAAYGDRLQGVVLYGSVARGQAGPESDVDVLVLLRDPLDYLRDLEAAIAAVYPLSVELGRRISAKPVSAAAYETVDCPLYRSAHREGIAA